LIVYVITAGAVTGAGAGVATAGTGGTEYVAPPQIEAVKCTKACRSGGRVQGGGRLKLRGERLADVSKVVYRGGQSERDDVSVRVDPASDSSVAVPVPMRAQTGPLEVWAGSDSHARTRKAVKILPPAAPTPNPRLSPAPGDSAGSAPGLETATSRSMFALDQRGGVKFTFRFTEESPESVQVTLLRLDDGRVIKTWKPPVPPAGETASVSWNGLAGKKAASMARYGFRLEAPSPGGAKVANAAQDDVQRDAFDLRPALFPVKGKHNYGGSQSRFGAGRSGHSHQGHDVMAKCGVPLRAARGGVVKAKQYQSAAGYYIVIDGKNTDVDFAYMHLAAPSGYEEGDRVRTGDQIGVVGDTGSTTACHLHFEMWRAPGWYTGGSPFDPLASLRQWDAYS
jgi:murein DD-endopeptidase MepM/ murein hydrolase activator NlpD